MLRSHIDSQMTQDSNNNASIPSNQIIHNENSYDAQSFNVKS